MAQDNWMYKYDKTRTLIDEMHSENRITNAEYDILRDCVDKAENEVELLVDLAKTVEEELESIATNIRRALRAFR